MKYNDNMTIEELLKRSSKKSLLKRILQFFKKKPISYEKALKNPLKHSKLDLRGLGLKELPESIGQFKNLTFLILDDNQLTSLPEAIGNLTQLDWLSLKRNQLTDLPDIIGNLTKLEYIDVESNKLTNLPNTIGNLTALRYLKLGNNNLTSLPDNICALKKVVSFDASDNKLTRLPELFGEMSYIQVLSLYNNQLTSLPDSIGNLKENVVYFNISNNRLKTLRKTLHKVVFEDIYLNNNELETLGTLGEGRYRIDQLHLNGNNLSSLPEALLERSWHYICAEKNRFTPEQKVELQKRVIGIQV